MYMAMNEKSFFMKYVQSLVLPEASIPKPRHADSIAMLDNAVKSVPTMRHTVPTLHVDVVQVWFWGHHYISDFLVSCNTPGIVGAAKSSPKAF